MTWRGTLLFWLDLINALLFGSLMATGGIIRWVLPPGSGRRGRWSGANEWLGFTRHEWGSIHFWIAATLVAGVSLHLALHARWIKAACRRLMGGTQQLAPPAA